jgi:polysaccharide deacetylase family protein (PEP-CTERM system associated)
LTILTFDIEDWFHTHQNRQQYSGHIWEQLPSKVVENTDRVLDVLEKNGLKATFFILGWVAKHHPELVKKIRSEGHEVGAHSFWYHNPHLITHSDFEKDLKLCLNVLQDITGEKVKAFRAPGFNLNFNDHWAFEILFANGITIDSSVKIKNPAEKIPVILESEKYKIMEFPQLTTGIGLPFSGGGFFRAIPAPVLNYLFKRHDYHLLYFHPRDFDPENPSTNLFSFLRNRLNTYNTAKCMDKLEIFLQEHKTVTLCEAAK